MRLAARGRPARLACTRARIDASKPSGAIHEEVGKLLAAALSLYDLDTDILRDARPTHIVTQDQCDVCAVGLSEVRAAAAAFLEAPVEIVSLAPMRLGDIWDDIARVGAALGVDSRAGPRRPARAGGRNRRAGQGPPDQARAHGRVDRPAHERRQLGAGDRRARRRHRHAGRGGTQRAGRRDRAQVQAADPDAIVLMPCGYDLPRTADDGRALLADPAWAALRAARAGAVYATDGNAFFNRPGPRLVESLEILAEILHPAHFDFGHRGTGWQRLTV